MVHPLKGNLPEAGVMQMAAQFLSRKKLRCFRGWRSGRITNDESIASKIRILRTYGSEKKYHNEVIGFNMRLDEMQAAFLSIKLQHLSKWTRSATANCKMV